MQVKYIKENGAVNEIQVDDDVLGYYYLEGRESPYDCVSATTVYSTREEAIAGSQALYKEMLVVQEGILSTPKDLIPLYSDGYHSFEELYKFREAYNAALFNEWAAQDKYEVHKSWNHHDGNPCFGGGWFIVVAMLPTGMVTNHYPAASWCKFEVPAYPKAQFEYDGHTPADVLDRLNGLEFGSLNERKYIIQRLYRSHEHEIWVDALVGKYFESMVENLADYRRDQPNDRFRMICRSEEILPC